MCMLVRIVTCETKTKSMAESVVGPTFFLIYFRTRIRQLLLRIRRCDDDFSTKIEQ